MEINIYRTYSFAFTAEQYVKNFKHALDHAGIKMPADFNHLLKNAGIKHYDYESVKSYFYGRRVPPLDVFFAVCKALRLNADDIAFPDSVQPPLSNKDICKCENYFRNVFYPYNPSEDGGTPENLTEFFDAETYESDVDELTLILSRYNYLIQKYHYAAVSNDELMQICYFTERYIIDRSKDGVIDGEEVIKWIRNCDEEDFLEAFYDRFTLGFYTMNCRSLLKILSTAIDAKFIRYAELLLPPQDRT